MEMCFHSNQHPSSIKHPFISLYSKYQSFIFTCFPDMNTPVFPILDDIYCTAPRFLTVPAGPDQGVSAGPDQGVPAGPAHQQVFALTLSQPCWFHEATKAKSQECILYKVEWLFIFLHFSHFVPLFLSLVKFSLHFVDWNSFFSSNLAEYNS